MASIVSLGAAAAPAHAAPGDLDPTFSDDGRQVTPMADRGPSAANAVARQADGKVVIVGSADPGFLVARLNADGSPDTSFSGDGRIVLGPLGETNGSLNAAEAVQIQPDGKLVVAGSFEGDSFDFAVVRLNADGTPDTSFAADGLQLVDFGGADFGHSVVLQDDGKVVVGGGAGNIDFGLARLQPNGSLDPTFDGDGMVRTDAGPWLGALDMALQDDGRIVAVGGGVENFPGPSAFAVLRYLPDGSLDTSFSGDGRQFTDFENSGNDEANAVAIQDDGGIVVVGTRDEFGSGDFALARYTSDGSLDTTFSQDGKQTADFGTADEGNAVALQPDGAIVAAGGAGGDFGVARFTAGGVLDSTFSGDGLVNTDFGGAGGTGGEMANTVALLPSGAMLTAGRGGADGGDVALAQYASDGSLDAGLAGDGTQTLQFPGADDAADVAIQGDGKIVAVGALIDGNGRFGVARYNPDGTLDPTFSSDGRQTTDFGGFEVAEAVALQDDGKIVVAGRGSPGFALARYNADGSLDTTFSGDGLQTTEVGGFGGASAVAIDGQGRIVAVGGGSPAPFGEGQFALVRYNPDGSLDTSFSDDGKQLVDLGTGFETAQAVALQPDGKIVAAGGSGDPLAPSARFALARFNVDGSLDPSFSGDGSLTTDFGNTTFGGAAGVAIQPDGNIVAVGIGAGEGGSDFALARYSPDGSLDAGFSGDGKQTTDVGGGVDEARDVSVQPDGKLVVAGRGGSDFAVARYTTVGGLDGTFAGDGVQSTDFNGGLDSASAVALQDDGNVVLAGSAGGESRDFALARYEGGDGPPPDVTPPDTSITAGPATGDTVTSSTVEFAFSASEPGSTFECSLDGSAFAACVSPRQLTGLANGEHTFAVRARDGAGNVDLSPASRRFVVSVASPSPPAGGGDPAPPPADPGGDPEPPASGEPQLPPSIETAASLDALSDPEPFREVNVAAEGGGEVFVMLPRSFAAAAQAPKGFIPLRQAAQLPVGSTVNADAGRVRVESAADRSGRRTQTAAFYQGTFEMRQERNRVPLTEMVLKGGSFRGCPNARGGAVPAARRNRRVRRLWGDGRGRFRTRGRYSSATVRGTKWLVEDRCDGTLTQLPRRPRSSRVQVRDFGRRITVTVRAGQQYLAAANPGKRPGSRGSR